MKARKRLGAKLYRLFYISMFEHIIDGEGDGSISGIAFSNISSNNPAVISRLVRSGGKPDRPECFET
jgi:hypothetical protein